jgi:hypothetical protein
MEKRCSSGLFCSEHEQSKKQWIHQKIKQKIKANVTEGTEQIASPWKDTSSELREYSQGTNWWRIWMVQISSKEVYSFLQTE